MTRRPLRLISALWLTAAVLSSTVTLAQPRDSGDEARLAGRGAGAEVTAESADRGLAMAVAETLPADAPVFYALGETTTLFRDMPGTTAYLELRFQEPLSVVSFHGPWMRVRTLDGAVGYVRSESVSDVWIRVAKRDRTVYVYRGERLEAEIPADLAYNFFADKQEQGGVLRPDHWRTPEGRFYVVARNPRSQFHRAGVLNYPTPEDARRGVEEGIVSDAEYRQILEADRRKVPPPMGTALGGLIEIHGRGTGARTNWTKGCIAIPDAEIDRLWDLVRVGTPVIVES